MASLTQWIWVWANSGRWWRTAQPDVLQSMGSQRIRHDWTTERESTCKMCLHLLLRKKYQGHCQQHFKWSPSYETLEIYAGACPSTVDPGRLPFSQESALWCRLWLFLPESSYCKSGSTFALSSFPPLEFSVSNLLNSLFGKSISNPFWERSRL